MTPTQKKELRDKIIFALIALVFSAIILVPIILALNNEAENINAEKTRIEQSVKIHDYDDQKY